MLKSKLFFGLMAAVMVLALAQSGYAQLQISGTGNPTPRETDTSRTAETNDPESGNGIIITGAILSDAFITGGRLRIDWPGMITNSAGFPAADAIRVTSATGIFTGSTIASVDNDDARIEITVPCGSTNAGIATALNGQLFATTTGTIIIMGVRLDAVGLTAPVSGTLSTQSGSGGTGCVGASVSPTNVLVSTTSIESITALAPGIGSLAVGARTGQTNQGTATVFTNRTVADPLASIVITEGNRTAWFDLAQFAGSSPVNDAQVRLTFSGIPTGVTLNIGVQDSSSGSPTLSRTAITTANNTSTISWGAAVSTGSTLDSVQINVSSIVVPSSGSLTAGSITVSATMAPVGVGFDIDTQVVDTSSLPRFSDQQVGPAVIATISPANTTLLVPFAVRDGAFDTGVSLANTTADPFGAATGGATAQAGSIRLNFFPRAASGAGTAFTLTTSSTVRPGIGLSSDGTLAAGSTWTVLLSELLTAAGQTGAFTGYIFIQTDFLNAHGAPFVSDFRNFTSFSPMLVLPSPGISPRTGGANAVETLTF